MFYVMNFCEFKLYFLHEVQVSAVLCKPSTFFKICKQLYWTISMNFMKIVISLKWNKINFQKIVIDFYKLYERIKVNLNLQDLY